MSNCESTEEFYNLFAKVAKNGYDKLEKGRFAALIIGDSYKNSEVQPLGFECMARMMRLERKQNLRQGETATRRRCRPV